MDASYLVSKVHKSFATMQKYDRKHCVAHHSNTVPQSAQQRIPILAH